MVKKGFIVLFIILVLFSTVNISSAETNVTTCKQYDHLGCQGGNVWWFDSCGTAHAISMYCGWNEECVEGQCKSKCGNGRCDSDENCMSCSRDCKCNEYERCWGGVCETYCGNGRCEGNENCMSCSQDCSCSEGETCVLGKCKTYCGNGRCDSDENCINCHDCQCSSSEECSPGSQRADKKGCVEKCGNGIRDPWEDCSSCPADAGCGSALYCYNGQCVDCIKDEHCTTRKVPTGEFVCSSDFRSTLEKVVMKAGICRNHQCTGEEEITTQPGKQCGDKLCQSGHCSCDEGYEVCLKTGKCEKIAALEDGSNCGCYFQCKSNYCSKEGKCIQALNTPISAASSLIKVGESTKVTISADNSLNVEIPTKMTLNIESGAIMSGVIGGSDCSGNQCTSGSIPIMPKSRESVTLDITGQSAGKVKFTAVITAIIEGEEYPITRETYITIVDPNDGQCTEGETSQNACKDCGCPEDTKLYSYACGDDNGCHRRVGWWIFIWVGIFIVSAVLLYFGFTRGKRAYERVAKEFMLRKHLKEKVEAEKKEKEEEERKKVVKALYAMKINWDNPPPIEEILKKIKVKVNEELIHEEYLDLMERAAKGRKLKEEVKKPKEEKIREQKFCTKCGNSLKPGVKFCTKCGSTIKKLF